MIAGCASAPEPYAPSIITRTTEPVSILPWHPVSRGMFSWPVKGYIISPYGAKIDRVVNKGIDIRAQEGSNVRAAKAGKVVYCNPYLRGFGKTVIIDHGNGIQTVYSYNSDMFVRVGDMVQQGSVIAKVGRSGRAKEPCLHFEVRKAGEPQNPFYYLR